MPARKQLKARDFFPDPQFRLCVMRVPSHPVMTELHSHDFDEVVVILAGRGKHRVGIEEYDLEAGEVFVILRGMSHCYPVSEGMSLINILYDPVNLRLARADIGAVPGYHALFQIEPRLRQQQRFKNRLKLGMDELGNLAKIIAELEVELQSKAPGSRFLASAHFMRTIGFLARSYGKMANDDPRPVTQISELLGYLEQHYAEPLTIEDLVRVAHASESSLYRMFRQIMGRSPIDYLIRLRIDKAAQLLRREPLRITEVSATVGFNDSNYFTRQFRHVMGCSPREYRLRSR